MLVSKAVDLPSKLKFCYDIFCSKNSSGVPSILSFRNVISVMIYRLGLGIWGRPVLWPPADTKPIDIEIRRKPLRGPPDVTLQASGRPTRGFRKPLLVSLSNCLSPDFHSTNSESNAWVLESLDTGVHCTIHKTFEYNQNWAPNLSLLGLYSQVVSKGL